LSAADLPPGAMNAVALQDREIVVCNTTAGVRALGDVCPHAGGRLSQGALHGDVVVCPWHAWEFSCVTGENDFDPGVAVPAYPAMVENGAIYVDPDAGTA
jgi:nitrite reductase/ring-hydroxylating ferredoxin subunit